MGRRRDRHSGGHTEFAPSPGIYIREQLEQRVELLLAGRAAEILGCGSPSTGSGGTADSDLGMAMQALATSYLCWGTTGTPRWRCPPERAVDYLARDRRARADVEKMLVLLAERALQTLTTYRGALDAIANRLMVERTLDRDEIMRLLAANPRSERPIPDMAKGGKVIPLGTGTNPSITKA